MERNDVPNKFVDREIQAIELLCEKWKCNYAYTGQDMFSRVDGFFLRENDLKGIFEVKCRMQGLSWFQDYKSVQVSYNKIQIGSDLSRLLKCKFFFVIQTCEGHLLVFQITDDEGKIICPMNIRFSDGEKTLNFDKKPTTNAFLMIDDNKYCSVHRNDDI